MKTKKTAKKPEAFKSLAEAHAAVSAHNARVKKLKEDGALLAKRLDETVYVLSELADTVDTGDMDDWAEPCDNED